ncbi:hypothetical protein BT63DRAFT_412122 [Microthyrium microscopicum]|uniref:C2H2-type domain-containing protein n=1 Tax=Microthyrium microscopicum TaxID=703497 RepID=A0A6A6UFJ4_9PEZI|nr:hypothetical protein BT63DRAFT_412122 [Microthyrium microscopicum]
MAADNNPSSVHGPGRGPPPPNINTKGNINNNINNNRHTSNSPKTSVTIKIESTDDSPTPTSMRFYDNDDDDYGVKPNNIKTENINPNSANQAVISPETSPRRLSKSDAFLLLQEQNAAEVRATQLVNQDAWGVLTPVNSTLKARHYGCARCNNQFKTYDAMLSHVIKKHFQDREILELIIGEVEMPAVYEHPQHRGDGQYVCAACGRFKSHSPGKVFQHVNSERRDLKIMVELTGGIGEAAASFGIQDRIPLRLQQRLWDRAYHDLMAKRR